MTLLLQSPSFDLWWEPQRGVYRFQSPGRSLEGIAGVEVLRHGRAHVISTADLTPGRVAQNTFEDAHGPTEELLAQCPENHGLVLGLRVRLYPGRPFALLQVSLTNVGPETVNVRRFFARTIPGGFQSIAPPEGVYLNGWQSWSPAGYIPAAQRGFPPTIPWAQTPMIHNAQTPRIRRVGRFWSESVGMIVTPREALIAGGASLADAFVQLRADVRPGREAILLQSQADDVPLKSGEARSSEWFYLEWVPLPSVDPLAQYAHAVARQMHVPALRPLPPGWSSWYIYWNKVREADMMENLANAALLADALPLQVIQLDEGYQITWGDWETRNADFSHDLKWLAERIRGSGFTPGLWLGPLTAHPKSRLAQNHPDWLLRDARGRPVSPGLISDAWSRALDPTHPGVEEHLRRLISTAVAEWGYDYLKLDFMYAGALPGRRYNPHLTRAQALRHAFHIIRETAGADVFLSGCGAPLGPAIGLVDAMRIGPDTAPEWLPQYRGVKPFFKTNPSMPGLRNSLRNVATRAWMHNRWWVNDPDVMMLRDTQTHLSPDEVLAQITLIGLSTNMFFFSDHLAVVPPARREMAAALFPPLLEGMDVLNLVGRSLPDEVVVPVARAWGRWRLLGLFNWSDAPIERGLPQSLALDPRQAYHIVDFWERRHFLMEVGGVGPVLHLPPHGAILLGLRPVKPSPQLVATTFHISQGGEIVAWEASVGALTLTLDLGRLAQGEIWLALPARPRLVTLNDEPLAETSVRAIAAGIWAIACHVNRVASVHISWEQTE